MTMKYYVNYEFEMITKRPENEKKPEPIKKNFRYDHGWSEWTEVDEETYKKMYECYYNRAINR